MVMIDDLYVDGNPTYTIEMCRETEEQWTIIHKEISQFTKLKGLFYLEDGQLNLSASDFAEVYTGRHDWKNYKAEFYMTPLTGENHLVNVRVQGAIRSYAVGFAENGMLVLQKNENGYRTITSTAFDWDIGKEYCIGVEVSENIIRAEIDGVEILKYQDEEEPYLEGGIGISVQKGSHCKCRRIVINS